MKGKILALAAMVSVLGTAVAASAQNTLGATVRQTYRDGQTVKARQLLNISQEYARRDLLQLSVTGQGLRPGVVLNVIIGNQVVARSYAPAGMQTVNFNFRNVNLQGGKNLQIQIQGGEFYLDSLRARFGAGMPGPGPNPGPYPPNPGPFPPGPGPGPQPGPQGYPVRVTCSSFKPLSASCPAGGYIYTARLVAQHSGDACVYGRTWWFDATNVIVTQGCRATFNVWLR